MSKQIDFKPNQILQIANKCGSFSVSNNKWRDQILKKKCVSLSKENFLRIDSHSPDVTIYKITNEGKRKIGLQSKLS